MAPDPFDRRRPDRTIRRPEAAGPCRRPVPGGPMSRRLVACLAVVALTVTAVACSSGGTHEAAPTGGGDTSSTPAPDASPTVDPEPGEERFADARDHAAEDSARLSALLDDTGVIPTEALVRWWATFEPVEGVTP